MTNNNDVKVIMELKELAQAENQEKKPNNKPTEEDNEWGGTTGLCVE